MGNWLKAACVASEISQEELCELLDKTRPTVATRLSEPGTLSLNELNAIYDVLDDAGKKIVKDAIVEILV